MNERKTSGPADRAALIEWELGAYEVFRRHRDATTPIDDLLPEEPLDHLDEARPAFELLEF
jgi:hypothetical protein